MPTLDDLRNRIADLTPTGLSGRDLEAYRADLALGLRGAVVRASERRPSPQEATAFSELRSRWGLSIMTLDDLAEDIFSHLGPDDQEALLAELVPVAESPPAETKPGQDEQTG